MVLLMVAVAVVIVIVVLVVVVVVMLVVVVISVEVSNGVVVVSGVALCPVDVHYGIAVGLILAYREVFRNQEM